MPALGGQPLKGPPDRGVKLHAALYLKVLAIYSSLKTYLKLLQKYSHNFVLFEHLLFIGQSAISVQEAPALFVLMVHN